MWTSLVIATLPSAAAMVAKEVGRISEISANLHMSQPASAESAGVRPAGRVSGERVLRDVHLPGHLHRRRARRALQQGEEGGIRRLPEEGQHVLPGTQQAVVTCRGFGAIAYKIKVLFIIKYKMDNKSISVPFVVQTVALQLYCCTRRIISLQITNKLYDFSIGRM